MTFLRKLNNFQFTKCILDKVFDIKNNKLQSFLFLFVMFIEFSIRVSLLTLIVYAVINQISSDEVTLFNSFVISIWVSILFNLLRKNKKI